MKFFTKVALVSAMAISANAMAAQLQALDDEALSATTGQDGITITLHTSGINIDKLLVHDNDGLDATKTFAGAQGSHTPQVANPNYSAAAQQAYDDEFANNGGDTALAQAAADAAYGGAYTVNTPPTVAGTTIAGTLGGTDTAGAIVINGVELSAVSGTRLATINIDTDAGVGGTDPFLNVGVDTGDINIKVDSIAVGSSNTAITGARRGVVAGTETKIVSGYTASDKIDVTVGGSKLNIQLGHTPQGAMILAGGTVAGGLTINNVAIADAAGGGVIGIDSIKITDASSTNLTANARISVVNNAVGDSGLKIGLGNNAQDIYLTAVRLGGNHTTGATTLSDATNVGTSAFVKNSIASIGDVELQGLQLNATNVIISGH